MNYDKREILRKAIITIILIIIILLMILGIQSSDFSKLKKYDIEGKSSKISFGSRNSVIEVSIVSKNEVNLGDFVFNVLGDKKLIANISVIHKPKTDMVSSDSAKHEFVKKGTLLRDATINAMLESRNFEMKVDNDRIKDNIKNKLNKNLENSTVEEVYFNKFIIQ